MKQDIWDQRARAVTVRMDIENGEVLEEVLEVLLGCRGRCCLRKAWKVWTWILSKGVT